MKALRAQAYTIAMAWLHGLLLLGSGIAAATSVEVAVVDRNAEPVAGVSVFWHPPAELRRTAAVGATAVMDQVDTRFVPHVLMVQTGTSVEFPNSDTVAHHVYSFSHPNHFKLPIYKGNAHPPVTFSESGIVILGCNIHDNMLGYILVVDTNSFAETDEHGIARFTIGEPEGEIAIWSPRFRDDPELLVKPLDPASAGDVQIGFQLSKALRPAFDEETKALSWTDY
ncbi:MAG: methylamine utilization protein [Gammaproteobacteria bacterium]|nr:methylamine utilization protein [Gammaproteobacteria bacterium]